MRSCRKMMSGGVRSSPLGSSTADEDLVAQILLDLPDIIRDSNPRSMFKWGCKRRRSRLDGCAPPSRKPSSHPPPSLQKAEARKSKSKAAAAAAAEEEEDGAASSPVTPLSFVPSESDEKKPRLGFKTNCTKRSREEYLDLVEELTQRRDILKEEIEKVTKYHTKLKASNSKLKAMKKEMMNSCRIKKQREMEMNRALGPTRNSHHQTPVVPHHQPLGPGGPVGSVAAVSPRGFPELNIFAGEGFTFDRFGPLDAIRAQADKRSRFAEARRLRKGIMKIKSLRRASGIKLPGARWRL